MKPSINWLFVFIPISIIAEYVGRVPHPVIFFLAALAILPIAKLIEKSTEQIANYTGDAVGGLLNATFANLPELIIVMVALKAGYLDMVRALLMAKRPAEAIGVLERTERAHWEHYLWLAACCASMGERAAAEQAGRQALKLRPNLSIATCVEGRFKWKRPEDRAHLRDALARAGLPA